MTHSRKFELSCPVPVSDYPEVTMAHGGGGLLTHRLVKDMFLSAFGNPVLTSMNDSAVIQMEPGRIAMTTDSYVVKPLFFPGGNIGDLAVNGTVNDLAMVGAQPRYLSLALIIEEGFAMADLWHVVTSISQAAQSAEVEIICGDTKVVERGSGDGLYINTSGIGIVSEGVDIGPHKIKPGDNIILSGEIASHGMAVMAVREGFEFETEILSDTAAVHNSIQALIRNGISPACLRDPTRGGVATTLVEIARACNLNMIIEENKIPVAAAVRNACDILGFDPLYVANEGCFIAIVSEQDTLQALKIFYKDRLTTNATVIGKVTNKGQGIVSVRTSFGGQRVLDLLAGEQLPRIC